MPNVQVISEKLKIRTHLILLVLKGRTEKCCHIKYIYLIEVLSPVVLMDVLSLK